jgi:hypothetical protein
MVLVHVLGSYQVRRLRPAAALLLAATACPQASR